MRLSSIEVDVGTNRKWSSSGCALSEQCPPHTAVCVKTDLGHSGGFTDGEILGHGTLWILCSVKYFKLLGLIRVEKAARKSYFRMAKDPLVG